MEILDEILKHKSYKEIDSEIESTPVDIEECYVELFSARDQTEKIKLRDRNHYVSCLEWLKDTFPESRQYLIGSVLRNEKYADIDIATIFQTEEEARKAIGFFNKMHKKQIIGGILGAKVTSIYAPGSYGGGTTRDTIRRAFCGEIIPWVSQIHISSREESFLEREVEKTEKRKKYYKQAVEEYIKKQKNFP